ncbi:MAG: tRNA (adenosine(37)-N6)-threonylcarbamoyltransferase complex ATPase subunit type 1 TsaE [Candidatus Omnitrophica bacterium]|nr:tRNA (adenosine(37)-N6)-threonylcarbamoyltransferase complex ATPase subunit type 1 TsaE [Candidatus Omnitrophota bacterium]
MQIITKNSQGTIDFGKKIAKVLKKGDIIAFIGNLGAGKTTLIKGIAQGLGVRQNLVSSPSFVLLKTYNGKLPVYHFDFYRIKKAKDSYAIGLDEFLFSDGVSLIEWADRIKKILPQKYLRVGLKSINENQRKIILTGIGKRYKDLIKKL